MFITFEGPEGGGKSSLVASIADHLRGEGHRVVVTREPGAGELGKHIRQILLHGGQLEPLAEVFLFLADRAQHVADTIRPAILDGKVVLCDRYADSTVVYQGYARGLEIDPLREWNSVATGGLQPNLTLLLDLEPQIGLARIASKDRLDAEPIEFHERVRQGFLTEAHRDPHRWVVVDADQPADAVKQQAWTIIQERLNARAFDDVNTIAPRLNPEP